MKKRHTIADKRIALLSIVLWCTIVVQAQTDTSRVEQYCQLIATQRILSNKVTIDIDFGDQKSYWKDGRLTTDDGKIRAFNTIIDAMNYMGLAGWIFINVYPVHTGSTEVFHFAFKKQFARADLQN